MQINNISQTVKQRYSCRSYTGEPIEQYLVDELNDYISQLEPPPFGSAIRFSIAAATDKDSDTLKGLGTYGFIKNPAGFIVGAMKKSEKNHEDYGYLMEKIVLKATEIGLGTCWLGGSFSKSSFSKRISAAENETVPAVISIGYPAEKKRFLDRLARWKMDSDNRKPWEDIFFINNTKNPASPHPDDPYQLSLELTRMAPSAVNRQPWRIIKEEKNHRFHFFLARTNNYHENLSLQKSDLQKIDMGIAMSHFDAGISASHIRGAWEIQGPDTTEREKNMEYISSWVKT